MRSWLMHNYFTVSGKKQTINITLLIYTKLKVLLTYLTAAAVAHWVKADWVFEAKTRQT